MKPVICSLIRIPGHVVVLTIGALLCVHETSAQEPQPTSPNMAHESEIAESESAHGAVAVHLTREDVQAAETKYSLRLQEFRRNYRATRAIHDKYVVRTRMQKLAADIETILPNQNVTELAVWLELLQNSYAAAGDSPAALVVLDRRYELVRASAQPDSAARMATIEALRETTMRHFDIAEALYFKALDLSSTAAVRFETSLARGRLIAERDGFESAARYYRALTEEFSHSLPELAREAHFRLAELLFQNGHLEGALEVLREIEAAYPNTPEAERARHTRRGWTKEPGEP